MRIERSCNRDRSFWWTQTSSSRPSARCWKALTAYYRVETVEKCYEEALTGDRLRPGYVEVDPAVLKGKLVINRVASLELAALALTCHDADALDAGEQHLFAHAHKHSDAWIATCADRAAVRIAFTLGWKERICSLEVLARPTGAKPALKRHFTERKRDSLGPSSGGNP